MGTIVLRALTRRDQNVILKVYDFLEDHDLKTLSHTDLNSWGIYDSAKIETVRVDDVPLVWLRE